LETLRSSIDEEIAEPKGSRTLLTDPDDQPIVEAAISADVDILISGDKHFLTLTPDRPAIMNARTLSARTKKILRGKALRKKAGCVRSRG